MGVIERDLMLDTPFLRRIREEGWAEGLDEGRTEGLAEGLAAMRQGVLDALAERFDPPPNCRQACEHRQVRCYCVLSLSKGVYSSKGL
jgi:hypothetical protein